MSTTETQAIAQLDERLQGADALLAALEAEAALFQRAMYKNRSQHRRAFFFQHLQQVKRCLRDAQLPQVAALFRDARAVLAQLRVPDGMHHVAWKALAAELKTRVDALLRGLAGVARECAEAVVAAQKAYKYPPHRHAHLLRLVVDVVVTREFLDCSACCCCCCTGLSAQFAMTYFMPFALMMNAILARLALLCKALLARAVETHGAVALLYLNEVAKANPLRARVTAVQLQGYQLPPDVVRVANV